MLPPFVDYLAQCSIFASAAERVEYGHLCNSSMCFRCHRLLLQLFYYSVHAINCLYRAR